MAGNEASLDAEKEISRIQLALLTERSRDGRQALLDELFRAEQFLSPARRNVSPLSSGTNRVKPVTLVAVQRSLESNEMLLEYVLAETQSYCLRITRSEASIVVLPSGQSRIERLVDNYVSSVRSRLPEIESAEKLFSVLLSPVVVGQPQTKLIVVPDGKLNVLPSEALRDSEGRYILESHVITYAPSATVLHLLRKEPRSAVAATRSFLGVGGPRALGEVRSAASERAMAQ